MKRVLIAGVALTMIYVVGPVTSKRYYGPTTVCNALGTSCRYRPECWYLGVAAVNVFETPGPSGICVDKATYDHTGWLSWFEGSGRAQWTA